MSKDWHTHRAAVALEATGYAVDETFTTVCPSCHGGSSGEAKLRVTRAHNGALFICLRASCGFRGFVAMDGTGTPKDTVPRPSPPRPLSSAILWDELAAREVIDSYLGFSGRVETYHLRAWGLRFLESDLQTRVFALRDLSGSALGHSTRDPEKKILTYRMRAGADMYAYYDVQTAQRAEYTVLVEDPISAMCCASHGFPAVALLGTNIPASLVSALEGRPVLLYLDPDAQAKGVKMAGLYGWKAVLSSSDPKDTGRLDVLLGEYR